MRRWWCRGSQLFCCTVPSHTSSHTVTAPMPTVVPVRDIIGRSTDGFHLIEAHATHRAILSTSPGLTVLDWSQADYLKSYGTFLRFPGWRLCDRRSLDSFRRNSYRWQKLLVCVNGAEKNHWNSEVSRFLYSRCTVYIVCHKVAAGNFYLGRGGGSLGGLRDEVQVPEAEAVCGHWLQISTAETIKIWEFSHNWPHNSWPVWFTVGTFCGGDSSAAHAWGRYCGTPPGSLGGRKPPICRKDQKIRKFAIDGV